MRISQFFGKSKKTFSAKFASFFYPQKYICRKGTLHEVYGD